MTIIQVAHDATEEDYDDYDELVGTDEWEDQEAYSEIMERMPNGWYMIKVSNFNSKKLQEIDEWCSENCRAEYKRIGWSSGCAYTVAVQFSESCDAVYFRLWSC